MSVQEIPNMAVFQSILTTPPASAPVAVITFSSATCGPCRALAPKLPLLASRFPRARFFKADVSRLSAAATTFGVAAVPTTLVFRGGRVVDKIVGADLARMVAAVTRHTA